MRIKKELKVFFLLTGLVFLAYAAYLNYPYFFYLLSQRNEHQKYSHYAKNENQGNILKPLKLSIPKIDFSQYVIFAPANYSSQMRALKKGPAHYGGSALPGQKGNIVIGGHYVSYVFRNLFKLDEGDFIELKTPGQIFTYKVFQLRLANEGSLNDILKLGNGKKKLLTLYTCDYPSSVTHKRFLIISKLINTRPQ